MIAIDGAASSSPPASGAGESGADVQPARTRAPAAMKDAAPSRRNRVERGTADLRRRMGGASGSPPARTLRSRCFGRVTRSEEHPYELQSLMRISYAVF